MAEKKVRYHAPLSYRIIFALLSIPFPGLGQALQKRGMRAFDFVLLSGASLLLSRLFIIQKNWGIWTPVLMLFVLAIPSVLSAISAFRDKRLPGDADSVVRSIFLYVFFYLIAIGPFYLINHTFGFKVYRFTSEDVHMEPLFFDGDATVIHRGAYGFKTFGTTRADSVKIGDVVFHQPVPENMGGDNFPVHMVLAAPMDTLRSRDGIIYVNSIAMKMPEEQKYHGPQNFGPVIVPKTQVFLTDNRGVFFPFYIDNIHGKVTGVLWSRTTKGRFRWDRFGSSIDELFEPYAPPEKSEGVVVEPLIEAIDEPEATDNSASGLPEDSL